jgi:hypothetical protein
MGAVSDPLFPYDDLSAMNHADKGRPSPPPFCCEEHADVRVLR